MAAGACVWQTSTTLTAAGVPLLFGVLSSILVYFAVSVAAVVGMAASLEGLPLGYVWLRGRQPILSSHLLLLSSGATLWCLWRAGELFPGGLVVCLALVVLYRSLQQAVLLRQQTADALFEIADMLEERDPYTHAHSLRVAHFAELLAARLGQHFEEASLIFLCGRLHDIGKCAIANEVLLKPAALDPGERDQMSRHAALGARMLKHFREFRDGAAYIRSHHEWYDGSGYPDGLARSEIPLGARIIAVADAYDAMTSDRPYRRALPDSEATRRLIAGAGSQWDPRVVLAFLELIGEASGARQQNATDALPQSLASAASAPA